MLESLSERVAKKKLASADGHHAPPLSAPQATTLEQQRRES
jgi:hypothetical protein